MHFGQGSWSDVESGLVYLPEKLGVPNPFQEASAKAFGYFTSISAFQKSVFFSHAFFWVLC